MGARKNQLYACFSRSSSRKPLGEVFMRKVLPFLAVAGLIFAALGLFPWNKQAGALVVPYNLEQLAQKSKFVLTGEVVELRSYRAPFQTLGEVIFTDVKIKVDSVLKGTVEGNEITIQVLGGKIGDAFQLCPESPRYEMGEKVCVFLREFNGKLWNTGWEQGKYKIAEGLTVRGEPDRPIAIDMSLPILKDKVRAYSLAAPSSTERPASTEKGGAK